MPTVSVINGAGSEDIIVVDGLGIKVPLAGLLADPDIWAIQWDGSQGEIEYRSKPPEAVPNAGYMARFIAAHNAAKPPPTTPTTPDQLADEIVDSVQLSALFDVIEAETAISGLKGKVRARIVQIMNGN